MLYTKTSKSELHRKEEKKRYEKVPFLAGINILYIILISINIFILHALTHLPV